jgi:hypothetical protein
VLTDGLGAIAPSGQQPLGGREANLPGGPFDLLAFVLAKDRVHESGGRSLPRPLYQFDAFSDSGMGRYSFQESQLIETEIEREANREVEPFWWRRSEMCGEVAKLKAAAQATKDQLVAQRSIARIKVCGVTDEQLV